jgi:hypothetical protein
MDAGWVEALAQTGAATLVAAIATDTWAGARAGLVRVFERGGHEPSAELVRRLDEAQAQLDAALPQNRDQVRAQVLPRWQGRLADLLADHPEAAADLQAWAAAVRDQLPAERSTWVQNNSPSDNATVYAVQGGNQIHHHHVGPPPASAS